MDGPLCDVCKFVCQLIFQEGVLTWSTKAGLETKFPTIAEKLKDVGYATHMLGK